MFITLEGIEGVGKTTAAQFVAERLQASGMTVIETREPGGTRTGEHIRQIALDPETAAMAGLTELLLMFAARAQHLVEVIQPALDRGHTVVCDRFTDATYAYQGGGRQLAPELIAQAEALVHPDLEPDLTLLLDAPIELALSRASARGAQDRFEREPIDFFQRVQTAYRERAAAHGSRFICIDASRSLAQVQTNISRALEERCT